MDLKETACSYVQNSLTIVLFVSSVLIPYFPGISVHGVTNSNVNEKYYYPFHFGYPFLFNKIYHVQTAAKNLSFNLQDGGVSSEGVSSEITYSPLNSSLRWTPQKQDAFSRYGFSPTFHKYYNSTTQNGMRSLEKQDFVNLSLNSKRKKRRNPRSATEPLNETQGGKIEADESLQTAPNDDHFSCLSHSSCNESSERKNIGDDIVERPACRCDTQCHEYGDCCHKVFISQHSQEDNKLALYSTEQRQISCVPLPRPFQEEAAAMVASCPTNSHKVLKEKCLKNVSISSYSPTLDIPVVSRESHVMYQNIFCAKCNDENIIERLDTAIECQGHNFYSWEALKFIEYKKGQLQWQNGSDLCSLRIFYETKYIRWCPRNLVKTCLPLWKQTETDDKNKIKIIEDCVSKTYYVKVVDTYYNNPSCVICNEVEKNFTTCLNPFKISKPVKKTKPYHLTSPFCDHSQVWNELYEICENAFYSDDHFTSNSSYFISTIDRPCTVVHFKRKFIVGYPNGSIYLRINKFFVEFGKYEFEGDWIALCKSADKWSEAMQNLSTLLLSMSLVCLAFHMAIFIYLPKRRNIPSMNLFSLVLALFLSELIFLCFFNYSKYTILCYIFATLLYYFLTASFLWMNVLSIDIWRTFRSSKYKIKSGKIFIQYSMYAWGVPLIPTVLVVLIDCLGSKDLSIIPGFASNRCWFNNMWGHAVFFTIPAGTVVIVNMFFYAFSVWGIYQQHKLSELATRSVQQHNKQKNVARNNWDAGKGVEVKEHSSNSSSKGEIIAPVKERRSSGRKNSSLKTRFFSDTENFFLDRIKKRILANKKNRMRLALYSKLALIMGMTWIFALMSLHTKNVILEYLFIIFNGTQGTMIFIAFDCKTKIWNDLRNRLQCFHTESFNLKDASKDYNNPNASYTQTERLSFPCLRKPSVEYNPQGGRKTIHEAAV